MMNNTALRRNGRMSLVHRIALAPYSVWAVIFILVPLVFTAYYAFTDDAFRFTFDNVAKFFTAATSWSDIATASTRISTL